MSPTESGVYSRLRYGAASSFVRKKLEIAAGNYGKMAAFSKRVDIFLISAILILNIKLAESSTALCIEKDMLKKPCRSCRRCLV